MKIGSPPADRSCGRRVRDFPSEGPCALVVSRQSPVPGGRRRPPRWREPAGRLRGRGVVEVPANNRAMAGTDTSSHLPPATARSARSVTRAKASPFKMGPCSRGKAKNPGPICLPGAKTKRAGPKSLRKPPPGLSLNAGSELPDPLVPPFSFIRFPSRSRKPVPPGPAASSGARANWKTVEPLRDQGTTFRLNGAKIIFPPMLI